MLAWINNGRILAYDDDDDDDDAKLFKAWFPPRVNMS